MIALSIAGFDPTGQAGILRDISVFLSMDLSFRAIPSALTVQSTSKVFNTIPIPIEYIKETLDRIEVQVDGVKIGMLYNDEVVKTVARFLTGRKVPHVVLDPVIRSSSGYPLISEEGLDSLKNLLIPISSFITPNLEEGFSLTSEKEPLKILGKLHSLGAKYIVITGVDGKDDYFFDGNRVTIIKGKPFNFSFHGSGCFYSSYLLTRLLLGDSPLNACKNTKRAIEKLSKIY